MKPNFKILKDVENFYLKLQLNLQPAAGQNNTGNKMVVAESKDDWINQVPGDKGYNNERTIS